VGAAGDEMEAPPLEARTGGKGGTCFETMDVAGGTTSVVRSSQQASVDPLAGAGRCGRHPG
jgi:hypothetical protein